MMNTQTTTLNINISGMSCSGCANTVQKALSNIEGVQELGELICISKEDNHFSAVSSQQSAVSSQQSAVSSQQSAV